MAKINKIILILLISLINIIYVNASDYWVHYNPDKYEEIKYIEKNINFWDIKVKYNIWFKNEIWGNSLFYPIKLSFSENNTSWVLEIYKEKFQYKRSEKIWQWEDFYKKIIFKNTNKLETFFYKNNESWYYIYYFYLNINWKKQKLEINNIYSNYDNILYITNDKAKNNFSTSNSNDLFIIKQFNKILLKRDDISMKELKILKNYISSWWNLVLDKELFQKYFWENKEIIKIKYTKDCNFYWDCNDSHYKKSKYFYKYWFWKIYLENRGRYISNNKNIFLSEDEAKKILIDEVIKSKFVPFDVILYFTIIYFITFLFINFVLAKKHKNNKFFLFYSIPAGALFFLIVIISISFYYKWFKDVENKFQINYHLNNKILSQVFIANFSPNWWDYNIEIDKENYLDTVLNRNYYFRENFSKKEIIFNNWKINRHLLWVNSSSILYFDYYKINKNSLSTEIFNPLKKFKTKFELLNYFNMTEEEVIQNDIINFRGMSPKEESEINNKIKEIIISEKETEFMKKISFGWEKNKNLVIDVFYK